MMLKFLIYFFLITASCSSQNYPEVENALTKKFPNPETFVADGIWIYNPEIKPKRLDFPIIENYLSGYQIFGAHLTNFLDYHVNDAECIVLFNNKTDELVFVEPTWYGGLDENFYRRLIGIKVKDTSEVKKLADEFGKLLLYDPSMEKIQEVNIENNTATISTLLNPENGTYRKIKLVLNAFELKEIQVIKPKTGSIDKVIK